MASLSGAVSDITGSIRGVLGLSRRGRLRDQLNETLDLHRKTEDSNDLAEARSDLAKVIVHQASALLSAVDPDQKRKLNWGAFAVAVIFFDIPLALLTFWGSNYREDWWGWVWTVLAGLLLAILIAATAFALVQQDDD